MAIPSVIRWYCVKTAKPIVDTLPSPGSHIILVLRIIRNCRQTDTTQTRQLTRVA